MSMKDVKPGDKLVRVRNGGQREIVTCRNNAGNLIDVGEGRVRLYYRAEDGARTGSPSFGSIRRPAAGELDEIQRLEAEAELARHQAHAERINRPQYGLARSITSLDEETLEKLTEEQLRTFLTWVESARAR